MPAVEEVVGRGNRGPVRFVKHSRVLVGMRPLVPLPPLKVAVLEHFRVMRVWKKEVQNHIFISSKQGE